jgi:integrase/recombinase XerC
MAINDKGRSWQIRINFSRTERPFIRHYQKSEYAYSEVCELEKGFKQELCAKPSRTAPGRNTLADVVDRYYTHIGTTLAAKTIKDQKRMLENHLLPAFRSVPLDNIDSPMIDEYITQRKKEIKSKAARRGGIREINLELLCLRAVSSWACDKKVNLATELIQPKGIKYKRPLPIILSKDELQRLFKHFSPRHKALYLALYHAGLRRDEAQGLTWDLVDFAAGLLRVLGKGDKERMVPMTKALYFSLWTLATARRNPTVVFRSRLTGGALTEIRKPLETAARKAGIKKRVYPHLLRHAFGVFGLDGIGGDLITLRDAMGHSDLETTKIYAKVLPAGRKRLIAALDEDI